MLNGRPLLRRPLRRSTAMLLALCSLAWSAGCGGSDPSPTQIETPSIVGNYTATTFQLTLTGQLAVDVLKAGGSLSLSIAADNSTSGTLSLSPSITGSPFTADLTGTAVQSGNTVHFQQTADTFVRDLTFTVSGNTLQATNQAAGLGTFTIVLTRL
jgi:hypothetical protein